MLNGPAYTTGTNGKLLTETLRNGSVTTDTTTYSYNAMGLPNTESHSSGASFNYAYYADGTLNTKTGDGKTVSYTYDAGDRLTSETERAGSAVSYSAAYTYDARGNRAKLTVGGSESYSTLYAYDANNQLQTETKTQGSKVDTTKYFYDPNGSQITKITSTTAGSSGTASVALVLGVPDDGLSVYDGLNRLVQVIGRTGTISYAYRPDGLRASKTAGGVVTNTLWDLTDVAAEVGGTGTTTYLRGAGLIAAKSSGAYTYYDKNAHGDVYRLLNSSGTATLTYVYDAFGVQRSPDPKATTTDTNPFRYCGEYWDSETGNYYLRARYYAPGIGRFTQMDSHWNSKNRMSNASAIVQSGNLYVYCGNNPILNRDPSGYMFPTNIKDTAKYLKGDQLKAWLKSRIVTVSKPSIWNKIGNFFSNIGRVVHNPDFGPALIKIGVGGVVDLVGISVLGGGTIGNGALEGVSGGVYTPVAVVAEMAVVTAGTGILAEGSAVATSGISDLMRAANDSWQSSGESSGNPVNRIKGDARANKVAQQFGYEGTKSMGPAEELKSAFVDDVSHFDMMQNTETKEIILQSKDGVQVPTGLFLP